MRHCFPLWTEDTPMDTENSQNEPSKDSQSGDNVSYTPERGRAWCVAFGPHITVALADLAFGPHISVALAEQPSAPR